MRRGDCNQLVRRARDLAAMPATELAYSTGEINGRHVDLVASCNREWRNADFADSEELLVNLCRTPFYGVAHRGIEYWKQCADLDAADRDADTLHTESAAVGVGDVATAQSPSTACWTPSVARCSRPNSTASANSSVWRICVTASNAPPSNVAPTPWSRWRCGRPPPPPTVCDPGRCSR